VLRSGAGVEHGLETDQASSDRIRAPQEQAGAPSACCMRSRSSPPAERPWCCLSPANAGWRRDMLSCAFARSEITRGRKFFSAVMSRPCCILRRTCASTERWYAGYANCPSHFRLRQTSFRTNHPECCEIGWMCASATRSNEHWSALYYPGTSTSSYSKRQADAGHLRSTEPYRECFYYFNNPVHKAHVGKPMVVVQFLQHTSGCGHEDRRSVPKWVTPRQRSGSNVSAPEGSLSPGKLIFLDSLLRPGHPRSRCL
jgi:hypothetical protein